MPSSVHFTASAITFHAQFNSPSYLSRLGWHGGVSKPVCFQVSFFCSVFWLPALHFLNLLWTIVFEVLYVLKPPWWCPVKIASQFDLSLCDGLLFEPFSLRNSPRECWTVLFSGYHPHVAWCGGAAARHRWTTNLCLWKECHDGFTIFYHTLDSSHSLVWVLSLQMWISVSVISVLIKLLYSATKYQCTPQSGEDAHRHRTPTHRQGGSGWTLVGSTSAGLCVSVWGWGSVTYCFTERLHDLIGVKALSSPVYTPAMDQCLEYVYILSTNFTQGRRGRMDTSRFAWPRWRPSLTHVLSLSLALSDYC